jgi:predicted nucleotidyltransferase
MAETASTVEDALLRIVRELDDLGQACALVGGLAVSARAEPRTTRDVDLAVSAGSDEAAEQLVWQLQTRGYNVMSLLEHEPTGRIATVRLVCDKEPSVFVDLLFASSGIETEIVAEAEQLEVLDELRLPVASRGHLIALKVLARDDRHRPQDWDDLRALLSGASDDDVRTAEQALALIELRGYGRGRDLRVDLARARNDTGT